MARQSISFTQPNDDWLKSLVESKEYTSKSEIVNDLIRQERQRQGQLNLVRNKLSEAENAGFTHESKEQILKQAKDVKLKTKQRSQEGFKSSS